ncbi:MAG: NAD(P)H-hydrate dehydratase [Polyangiaceae bacterium]|nr:NAD(P)H-hydrate dehydratase [Polyangiaceae bacterium]
MIGVLSRAQSRALDALAIQRGVAGSILMENAGRGAADVLERVAPRGPVVVLCGPGNNGGDGYVLARHLRVRGWRVEVVALAPGAALRGDAAVAHAAYAGTGGSARCIAAAAEAAPALAGATVVVDALFGTGLTRELEGLPRELIHRFDEAPGVRVALDLPSGLDADRGVPLGCASTAQHTITFAAPKLGLYTSAGARHAGRVHVTDIGVPPVAFAEVGCAALQVERGDVAALLAPRPVDTHKGTAGRVVVVAGSPGKVGAALLAARGALRAGAGLVTLAAREDLGATLDGRLAEAMTLHLGAGGAASAFAQAIEGADAVVLGPGLGLDERARALVAEVLRMADCPVVVDADAITLLARDAGLAGGSRARLAFTPHAGELARLLALTAAEVERDRFGAVARAVERVGAPVLLKGPRTIVGAPGAVPTICAAGSPALASGGSGDVLSGIVAALSCSLDPAAALVAGAHLHAWAGEAWSERRGGADRGLLAHELADLVPAQLAALAAAGPALPD